MQKRTLTFIACAFRHAKKLGMDALAIAVYARDYILKHLGAIPRNMSRWTGYVAQAERRATA